MGPEPVGDDKSLAGKALPNPSSSGFVCEVPSQTRAFAAFSTMKCRWSHAGCVVELKTKSQIVSQLEPRAAATVAGEDLACGDYVALLNETVDFPSFLWDACGALLSPHELVRLKVIPGNAGHPLRVIAVCLPFVYAKTPSGETATIDTRRTQLVRLDRKCAKAIWKELRSVPKQNVSL
jgi:hypothetical protein